MDTETIKKIIDTVDSKLKERGFYESYDDRTVHVQLKALWTLLAQKEFVTVDSIRATFDAIKTDKTDR